MEKTSKIIGARLYLENGKKKHLKFIAETNNREEFREKIRTITGAKGVLLIYEEKDV